MRTFADVIRTSNEQALRESLPGDLGGPGSVRRPTEQIWSSLKKELYYGQKLAVLPESSHPSYITL